MKNFFLVIVMSVSLTVHADNNMRAYNKKCSAVIDTILQQAMIHHPYWAEKMDDETIKCGFMTYHQAFASKVKHKVTYEEFQRRLVHAKRYILADHQLLALGLGNERLERYWDCKTPEEAYPEGDRPRKEVDINAIYSLMKTEKPVSPILLGRIEYIDGFQQIIVLDGSHRIAAAHLINTPIAFFLVDLTESKKRSNAK